MSDRKSPQLPEQRRLVDLTGAADYLQVSPRWIRRAVDERRLPYHKVGRLLRFDVADLDAYLSAHRVPAEAS